MQLLIPAPDICGTQILTYLMVFMLDGRHNSIIYGDPTQVRAHLKLSCLQQMLAKLWKQLFKNSNRIERNFSFYYNVLNAELAWITLRGFLWLHQNGDLFPHRQA